MSCGRVIHPIKVMQNKGDKLDTDPKSAENRYCKYKCCNNWTYGKKKKMEYNIPCSSDRHCGENGQCLEGKCNYILVGDGKDCQFLTSVTADTRFAMDKEHEKYKKFEEDKGLRYTRGANAGKLKDSLRTGTQTQQKDLKKAITMRKAWLEKYFKTECYSCDSACRNHLGMTNIMEKKTQKKPISNSGGPACASGYRNSRCHPTSKKSVPVVAAPSSWRKKTAKESTKPKYVWGNQTAKASTKQNSPPKVSGRTAKRIKKKRSKSSSPSGGRK